MDLNEKKSREKRKARYQGAKNPRKKNTLKKIRGEKQGTTGEKFINPSKVFEGPPLLVVRTKRPVPKKKRENRPTEERTLGEKDIGVRVGGA